MPLQRGALPGHWPHVTLALGQGFNLTAFALSLLLVRLLWLPEMEEGQSSRGSSSSSSSSSSNSSSSEL